MLIPSIQAPHAPGSTSIDYEQIFAVLYNNHSATTIAGGHVCYDPAATVAQHLGRAFTRPATANLALYAGVTVTAIDTGKWGPVLIYGVVEECAVDGGTTDATTGLFVIPVNGSFYANAPTAVTVGTHTPWITVMESITTTSGTTRCLIRAM